MKIFKLSAGHYWSDGGALLGVLPYAIWKDKVEADERRRKKMELNLLLIITEGRRILIDTGLGNRISEKQRDIYRPSEFALPASIAELGFRDTDITDVILTHLHFDHAGGIVTAFHNHEALTFPKAKHWIQKDEWEMAKNPDSLNKAAYLYEEQLALLEREGDLELIDGDFELAPGVKLIKCGGHTVGTQYVEIAADDGFYIYAGDIIATYFHTRPAITSAYDVCRADTVKAKERIYKSLKEHKGTLLINHDPKRWDIHISELRV